MFIITALSVTRLLINFGVFESNYYSIIITKVDIYVKGFTQVFRMSVHSGLNPRNKSV